MPDTALIHGILASAGAGTALIVIMLLTGILNTRQYTRRVEKEAETWKSAYEAERAASAVKDQALAAAVQRADAAVEAADLTRQLLDDLRRRADAVQKTR